MKSFLEVLQEDKNGEVHHVMTFGRMNPPTTGHLKLIDKVKEVAAKHKAGHTVITSHSQDKNKNPLSAEQKVKHLKRYSPGTNFAASDKEHPTLLHHAAKLHKQGVTHLHMVVGSDRVKEMKEKLAKYNGTHPGALYNFKKITVHSAGHRDPDAEGTTGMSGTKMREHARNKDISKFNRLLEVLASQSGKLLNVMELSNTCQLSKLTVEKFLFILENFINYDLLLHTIYWPWKIK